MSMTNDASPRYYLVKRNPDLSGMGRLRRGGDAWFVQTRVNGWPVGSDTRVGDVLFVYEVGYAVWAKGEVTERTREIEFRRIEDLLNYARSFGEPSTNFRNYDYWGKEILRRWPKLRNDPTARVCVTEVKAKLEVLEPPIFLQPDCMGRFSWMELKAPWLPIETWKLAHLTELDLKLREPCPVGGPMVLRPFEELFAAAWQRVLDGDEPRYEEAKRKKKSK